MTKSGRRGRLRAHTLGNWSYAQYLAFEHIKTPKYRFIWRKICQNTPPGVGGMGEAPKLYIYIAYYAFI